MNNTFYDFIMKRKGIVGFLHLLVLLLSLILVVSISVDTFAGIPYYDQPGYWEVQFWICILFLLDFLLEFSLAPDRRRYLATHFIFLLVAIPYHSIVTAMGWHISTEVGYLLRFIPLIRGGYALAIVVGWFSKNRATTLFATYLGVLASAIYFASLAFFVIEQGSNPLVKTYGDALWWATMDATTVGSNIIAVTAPGKVLSVLVASLGMMMFPIFTVYITNLIEEKNKAKQAYYKKHEGA